MNARKLQCSWKNKKKLKTNAEKTPTPSSNIIGNSNKGLKRETEPLKVRMGFSTVRLYISPPFSSPLSLSLFA